MTEQENRSNRANLFFAAFVWIVSFIIYYMTLAPTLSFWDCGEFIAAAVALQIPHPPGSPVYILLGRIFSLLPIASDLAVRVNLLSAVSSSFTAFFGYLVASHILRKSIDIDGSVLSKMMIYGGAACGAFFLAFGFTNWNNSVEAEVYGLAMMLTMAIFYLSLLYWEKKGTVYSEKLMYLIFLLAFLGVGVHMSTYLILPVLALFFIVKRSIDKHIWFIFGALFLFELYLIFAFSSRPNEIPFYIPIVIVFAFYLFYIFSYEKMLSIYMYTGIGFLVAVLPLIGDLLYLSDTNRFLAVKKFLDPVGLIGFAGLILLGIYCFTIYLKSRSTKEVKNHHLIASLFVFVTGLMVLLLFPIHGYAAYVPFLIVTVILGGLFLLGIGKDINWLNLIAIGSVSLVIIGVNEFVYGMLGAAILIMILSKAKNLPGWKNALLIILVSVIGYSAHLYIPIRSQQNPIMNENNPGSSVQATIDYIERKQYGSMSMTMRMFERRAEWTNQFGTHRHMGFWGYFDEQYGVNGTMFIPLFLIGLFGVWEVIRKRPSIGVPFLLVIVLSSIGLILYMNFADGTRIDPVTGRDYLEVRDRDYFFTSAFIFFGLAIGVGMTFIVNAVREWIGKNASGVKTVGTIGMFVLYLLPVYAVAQNYNITKRTNNYMPYDYGWNLLASADKNAILFTVGDNDTFTLWCLQDVYKFRNDVAVVNLSLANTHWYIKQLPTNLKVRTSWSEEQVDRLRPFRDETGNVYRLDAQVISEVIKENYGKRPINFSVTVPEGRWQFFGRPLDSLMELNGMVWRMTNTGGGPRVSVDSSLAFLTDPERMRLSGISDPEVYKSPTALRLTRNYARTYMRVADTLRRIGEFDQVESLMRYASEKIPHSRDAAHYLVSYYAQQKNSEKLAEFVASSSSGDPKWMKSQLAKLYAMMDEYTKSEELFQEILREYPDYKPAFEDLMRLFYEQKDPVKMKQTVQDWLVNHPDDQQVKALMNSIDREFERLDQEQSQQP